jgi:multidrug efflux pump subunit AcrA (membrane-fusion protein)
VRPRSLIILLALPLAAACKPDAGDAPRDEAPRGARTVWHGDIELFVDHAVPVRGEPAVFAIHLSDLRTGRPIAVERIAVSLGGPGGEARKVDVLAAGPGSAGIYPASLTLETAGEWTLSVALGTVSPGGGVEDGQQGGGAEIPFGAFTVHASREDAAGAPPPAEAPGAITFLKEEQWPSGMLSRPVELRPLAGARRFPALVKPRVGGRAAVVPPIAGRLLAAGGGAAAGDGAGGDGAGGTKSGELPRLGERVEAGQVIARVEPPLSGPDLIAAHTSYHMLDEHEAELSVKIAEARAEELRSGLALELAERALARVRGLAAESAKSERELAEAEFEAQAARAAHEVAKKVREPYEAVWERLHSHPLHERPILDRFPALDLVAPIGGRIDAIGASLGEHVGVDRSVFTIMDTAFVHVEALVPEHEIRHLERASQARLELRDPSGAVLLSRPLEHLHTGLEIDRSRRLPIVYLAANDDGLLRLGMSVDAVVETASLVPRLVVPAEAIIDDRGVPVVFVQLGGETFVRRPVRSGIRSGGLVEVTEGVSEGDRVVTRGAYLVRLASLSGALPDHHH